MAPKRKKNIERKPVPEDYELSDDEPTMVDFDKEQKLTSKNIVFDCPLCHGKLQLQNEIEINPKGITCRCSPCSFKISRTDKTMNVSKDEEGGITLDSQDHSISFSFKRISTPEREEEKTKNQMISDIMGTPTHKQPSLND